MLVRGHAWGTSLKLSRDELAAASTRLLTLGSMSGRALGLRLALTTDVGE